MYEIQAVDQESEQKTHKDNKNRSQKMETAELKINLIFFIQNVNTYGLDKKKNPKKLKNQLIPLQN